LICDCLPFDENVIKIGPVDLEIIIGLQGIGDMPILVESSRMFQFVTSSTTNDMNVTKFTYNVQKLLPFKIELRCSNPFWNAIATNEGGISQVYLFSHKQ